MNLPINCLVKKLPSPQNIFVAPEGWVDNLVKSWLFYRADNDFNYKYVGIIHCFLSYLYVIYIFIIYIIAFYCFCKLYLTAYLIQTIYNPHIGKNLFALFKSNQRIRINQGHWKDYNRILSFHIKTLKCVENLKHFHELEKNSKVWRWLVFTKLLKMRFVVYLQVETSLMMIYLNEKCSNQHSELIGLNSILIFKQEKKLCVLFIFTFLSV